MLDAPEKEDSTNGVDIESYQVFLEHILAKLDHSVDADIFILQSNLHLSIGKTQDATTKF